MAEIHQMYHLEKERESVIKHMMTLCPQGEGCSDGTKMLLLAQVVFEAVCYMAISFEGPDGREKAIKAANETFKNIKEFKDNF